MSLSKLLNVNLVFPFLMAGVLVILLFPIPTMALDVLLVLNLAISLLIFLIMFYIQKPLDISSFPTILLVTTLFRLALNVASTKLILLDANAGVVIDAFGKFVIQNNYIIGAVVFVIILTIQFMVITKGSTRISEVAARFTLDAMPGKQMSIDADLNAGIIDETEAKQRRESLSDEAEFYGSMDGAVKFVQGDVKAGMVICAINIIGGICIGMFQKNMELVEALQRYTILTIGDGLVSQIPALMISVASGILVAKTESKHEGLGGQLSSELFRKPEPLFICATMLFILAVLPGFPFLPFMILAASCVGMGMIVIRRGAPGEISTELALAGAGAGHGPGGHGGQKGLPPPGQSDSSAEKKDEGLPQINPMTLEVGFSLVPLVDPNQGGDLVDRIGMIRKQIREDMGFLIPPISIQDNIALANNEYRILVRGLEKGRGVVHVGSKLAINPGDAVGKIEGIRTNDPAFGFEAVWINPQRSDAAEGMGYTVVDPTSVVATHVTKVVKDSAPELLSRQDVSDILEEMKKTNAAVVEELASHQLAVGSVHRVLQLLLEEKIPIHDLPTILETLADYALQTKDPNILCEFCRQALKGRIVSQYLSSDDRTLYSITLHPSVEEEVQASVTHGKGGMVTLPPERAAEITNDVKRVYDNACGMTDADIVLLASPLIRMHLSRLMRRKMPNMPVLSYAEISDDVSLRVIGSARAPRGAQLHQEEFAA